MSLWGNTDVSGNSVKYATELTDGQGVGSGNAAKAANNAALFGNTTIGAFTPGKEVGQFPVTVQEMANTQGERKAITAAGWNMRHAWTGPVSNLAITAGGATYSNTDVGTVANGQTNATFSVSTNSTGGIVSTSLTAFGNGFVNSSAVVVTIANSTGGASAGSGATFTVNLGGRAGRVFYENIVAMGTISSTGNSIPTT